MKQLSVLILLFFLLCIVCLVKGIYDIHRVDDKEKLHQKIEAVSFDNVTCYVLNNKSISCIKEEAK